MSSITIVSDATIWSVTYNRHYDDRKSFIIQATAYFLLPSPNYSSGEALSPHLSVTNTLAYYDTAKIMSVKGFIVHAPGVTLSLVVYIYLSTEVTMDTTSNVLSLIFTTGACTINIFTVVIYRFL